MRVLRRSRRSTTAMPLKFVRHLQRDVARVGRAGQRALRARPERGRVARCRSRCAPRGASALNTSSEWSRNDTTITSSTRPCSREQRGDGHLEAARSRSLCLSSMLISVSGKVVEDLVERRDREVVRLEAARAAAARRWRRRGRRSPRRRGRARCRTPGTNQCAASSALICASVICSTVPLPLVVRSTVVSCSTTTSPSAVRWTSSSSTSTPLGSAVLKRVERVAGRLDLAALVGDVERRAARATGCRRPARTPEPQGSRTQAGQSKRYGASRPGQYGVTT